MPSRSADRALAVIADNITLARGFLGDMSVDAFAADERTLYAVTRCLEIISEASRRLPDAVKARPPDIPWGRISAAGNAYRHDYEDVAAILLWNTVKTSLSSLERAVREELNHRS